MTYTERLLAIVDQFCARSGMTREQVSYQVFRDQRRIARVADGKASITVRLLDSLLIWLSENWPADTDWPGYFDRPLSQQVAQ
ncbi:hypothetical protein V6617_10250 [Pelagibacterium nitratireducens]|uniref:Transcriptional regulator n=1 Tax=Pelagibacterium nitratireducens TaxID=1046114 RepID=A0ABZ2I072_9HYPH